MQAIPRPIGQASLEAVAAEQGAVGSAPPAVTVMVSNTTTRLGWRYKRVVMGLESCVVRTTTKLLLVTAGPRPQSPLLEKCALILGAACSGPQEILLAQKELWRFRGENSCKKVLWRLVLNSLPTMECAYGVWPWWCEWPRPGTCTPLF